MTLNTPRNLHQEPRVLQHSLVKFNGMKRHKIISYLKNSHRYYEGTVIPQIEQSFLGVLKLFPNEPSLTVIFNLFVKFQISLELHMKLEEETIYKHELNQTISRRDVPEHLHEEPFLTEIISCLNRQYYANNPFCQILIHQLVNFDQELQEHSWIEDNLI